MKKLYDKAAELRIQEFTDKDSYLKWVKEWQEFYEELSQLIRLTRNTIKDRMRQNKHDGSYNTSEDINLQKDPLWQVQNYRSRLSEMACFSLLWRMDSKERSWSMKKEAEKLQLV